jgi:hypothetical protein
MISMIQEFAWAGLVNDSDVLLMVQRSTVSGDPFESLRCQLMMLTVRSRRVRINHCAANPRTFDLNNCLQDVTSS